jgi:ParB-like chromosome segregation protein Spo0J
MTKEEDILVRILSLLKLRRDEFRIGGMTYEHITVRKIDLRDERFRTSYHFSLDRLILSIKKAGLLSPPLVRRGEKGFVLVSGWKRALACRTIGLTSINVLVTEEKNDLHLFLGAFYENLATREISLVEKAEIGRKLLGLGVDRKTLLGCYLPLLSFPATAEHLEVLLALSRAALAVREFVWEKDVPLPVVQSLLRFAPIEQKVLLPLLRPLGQNKQRELLEDAWDICRRDNVTVRKLLNEAEARQALASPKLSPQQKAEKIRLRLKRKRYPRLSSFEDSFDSVRRRTRWPKDIAIQPSPYFESEDFSVSFRFKNEKEFKACVEKLQEIGGKKEFSGLFKR